MPVFQGQVGTQGVADGTYPNVRMDKFGGVVVTELNARYYEQAYRGSVFMASNSAATAFTIQGTTGATGFILSNTAGNSKNLVILDIIFQYTIATAAAAVAVLYAGTSPLSTAVIHTTPLTVTPAIIGSTSTAIGKADSAATIVVANPSLVPIRIIQAAATTGAAAVVLPYVKDEVAGAVIVPPGCFVAIQGTAAIAGGVASMTWMELPV